MVFEEHPRKGGRGERALAVNSGWRGTVGRRNCRRQTSHPCPHFKLSGCLRRQFLGSVDVGTRPRSGVAAASRLGEHTSARPPGGTPFPRHRLDARTHRQPPSPAARRIPRLPGRRRRPPFRLPPLRSRALQVRAGAGGTCAPGPATFSRNPEGRRPPATPACASAATSEPNPVRASAAASFRDAHGRERPGDARGLFPATVLLRTTRLGRSRHNMRKTFCASEPASPAACPRLMS